jgi:hypothetical protein
MQLVLDAVTYWNIGFQILPLFVGFEVITVVKSSIFWDTKLLFW